jgi:hypothetical protein
MTHKLMPLATIKQDVLFFSEATLQRALRERYARRTGVFAFPFRGTPFDLPVNSDEGRMLSSSLFDQGRQNP